MEVDRNTIYPIFTIDGRKIQSGVKVHEYLFGGREPSPVVAVGARATVAAMGLVHVSGITAGKVMEAVSIGETRQGGVRFEAKPRPIPGNAAVVVIRDEKEYARFATMSMTSAKDLGRSRQYSHQSEVLFGGDVSGCVCGSEMCKAALPLSAIDQDACPKCRRHIQPSFTRKAFPGKWIKEGRVQISRERWAVKEGIALIGPGQVFSLATSSPATDSTLFYRWNGTDKIEVWDAPTRIEYLLDATS